MPRTRSTEPRLVRQQERQRKYRAKLRAVGRPEASQVDIAVAASTARAVRWLISRVKSGKIGNSDPRRHLLDRIVTDATKLLVDSGCSADEATAKISARFQSERKPRLPPITS